MTAATPLLASQPSEDAHRRETIEAIAANVARLRRNSGYDVEALAVVSGLAIEHLRAVEAAQVLPPLRALWALADTFGVPFGVLLSGAATSDATFGVVRASETRLVESNGGFRSRPLSATGDPREPEVYEITLAPGWIENAAPHAAETFEHIVVIRGALEIHAGTARAVLGPGDAVFFRADRPHAYGNPSTIDTVLQLTMTYAGDWAVSAGDFG